MPRVTINLDQIAIAGARRAPRYMHFGRGLLFAQIKVNSGRFVSAPLGTSNVVVAAARMVPLIEKLIKAGELERNARVCRLYLPGRCPRCGRPLPGI